ncbi:hypothetical protein EBT16_05215 [bacterium]|nr:hypothetical protein [bacterium]
MISNLEKEWDKQPNLFWKAAKMANLIKVLIADGLAEEGIAALKKLPQIQLEVHSALERPALKEKIKDTDILVVRSRTKVDRDLLEHTQQLKIVLRAGIGLDNVDVPVATDKGVIVMNAPTGNIVTTAEHALALLFSVTRNVPQADASLRAGKWEKKLFQGNELRGKTLGLLGLGNIGKVVASRAIGLEMKVCAHDPYVSAESAAKMGIELKTFDELLEVSDYVSIHVPLIPSTKHLINEKAFKKMKGSGKIKSAEWLKNLGVEDDDILDEAEKKSAQQAFAALTAPLDAEQQKKALATVEVPAAVKHLVGMLTAYDWAFVEQAKELRGYCIAQLVEETKHPDAKIRLKAVELLGKVTEIALFTERVEVKKAELSDAELQAEIDKRMGKYMELMKVVEGETLDNDATLLEVADERPAES